MSFNADLIADEAQSPPRAVQLRLFPTDSPLIRRFGRDFFRRVPDVPGVYLMRNEEGRLLYVGKARNLRQRLGSYRYLQGASRKTVRMVHQVASIEWEPCGTEQEALLRENVLLRTDRPRFNRVGTWPRAYGFIRLWRYPDGFGFQLENGSTGRTDLQPAQMGWLDDTLEPVAESHSLFGAFKSAHRAFASLARLLWVAMGGNFGSLPRVGLGTRGPQRFLCRESEAAAWHDDFERFLAGTSDGLLARLAPISVAGLSAFDCALRAADVEAASDFFRRGPRRNEDLRRRAGRSRALFSPEDLDDLLVIHRPPADPA